MGYFGNYSNSETHKMTTRVRDIASRGGRHDLSVGALRYAHEFHDAFHACYPCSETETCKYSEGGVEVTHVTHLAGNKPHYLHTSCTKGRIDRDEVESDESEDSQCAALREEILRGGCLKCRWFLSGATGEYKSSRLNSPLIRSKSVRE